MRQAYISGIPGVFSSGIIWLLAGLAIQIHTDVAGMAALFFGGMAIHPASTFISRRFLNAPAANASNPLNKLALEITGFLFVGLLIAYAFSLNSSGMFFTTMLLIVGTRYLAFQTLYGIKLYWILGVSLVISGVLFLIAIDIPSFATCYIGGAIELLFTVVAWLKFPPGTRNVE